MPKAKDFYSKSVADAIRQACAEFATSQEKLDIEVLETGSAGIFGLCKKRAHIRVGLKKAARHHVAEQDVKEEVKHAEDVKHTEDVKHAEADAEVEGLAEPVRSRPKPERKRTPKKERPPAPPKDEKPEEPPEPPTAEALESVKSDLMQILGLMGLASDVTVGFEDGNVQCRIGGDHEEDVVGPEGRTLDSLQYLLRKMMSRVLPDRVSIDLDCGNFRERRMEELQKLAVELAGQVKEDGKTQSIPALNPSERRVVHVVLQEDKDIRSRSVGEGLFKKVLIYKPGKSRKTGSRRKGRQGGRSSGE